MNSKLILFEGIPGTGKSTLAQFLYIQMLRNGVDTRYFHEEEYNHPLFYPPVNIQSLRNDEELKQFLLQWPEQWKRLTPFLERYDAVLLTSYFFEDGLRVLFNNCCTEDEMISFAIKIVELIRPFNPVILFLRTRSTIQMIENLRVKRGPAWMHYFSSVDELTVFSKKRRIKGVVSSIVLWAAFQKVCLSIIDKIEVRKLIIDVTMGNWLMYQRRILEFLEYGYVKDPGVPLVPADSYCGFYLSESQNQTSCTIKYNGLFFSIDFLWPDLKLQPVTSNRFWIQSLPLQIVFSEYHCNFFTKIIIEGTAIYDFKGMQFKRVA